MRHVPRQPQEGINVSDTHPLVEAGTLIVGLSAIFIVIVVHGHRENEFNIFSIQIA